LEYWLLTQPWVAGAWVSFMA